MVKAVAASSLVDQRTQSKQIERFWCDTSMQVMSQQYRQLFFRIGRSYDIDFDCKTTYCLHYMFLAKLNEALEMFRFTGVE